jgi:hypothetical protein
VSPFLVRSPPVHRSELAASQNMIGPATDHNVKVDKLFCNGRHIVLKAERILSQVVRCQDVVALSLLLSVQDDHFPGVFYVEINIE